MDSEKKLKILFLVQLPPPVHGVSMMNEITTNSSNILNSFITKVVTLNYTADLKGIGEFSWKKLFSFFRIYKNIIQSLVKFKPNIIYFTLTPVGISFYRDAFIVLLLKTFKSKIVFHLHGKGIYAKTEHSTINKKIYQLVFKGTYVIHLSESLKKDIELVNNKVKSYVIPNGINSITSSNPNINKNAKKKRLLFLSNLAENKGVLMYLVACKFLKDNEIPFSADVVGRETTRISQKDIINKIIELNLENEVNFLGPKYNADKDAILANADIFVFPSYNDCFPLVLLEAFKYGLPVISTNEGALGEIVDNNVNGFVVNRKDQDELNLKLRELILDTDKISEFSKNAREKFMNSYTTECYEKNMLSVLKDIAND